MEHEFDRNLEPHRLTDKDETKELPCRVCKRPCIVNRYASLAKTACNDHRDRHSETTRAVEGGFDESKEEHVLTDKAETKRVPCRSCRRPCVVTMFATPEKVACRDCRTSVPAPVRRTHWKQNGDRMEEVTEVTTFTLEQFLEVANKPTLPYWPDGDDEDRAKLMGLARVDVEAQLLVEDLRADYLVTTREIRRTEEYRTASTEDTKNHLLENLAKDLAQVKSEGQIKKVTKQIEATSKLVTQEGMIPPEPKSLTEAIEDQKIAANARHTQRQIMVDKLTEAGYENPYTDLRDKATNEIEQIRVHNDLKRLEAHGLH